MRTLHQPQAAWRCMDNGIPNLAPSLQILQSGASILLALIARRGLKLRRSRTWLTAYLTSTVPVNPAANEVILVDRLVILNCRNTWVLID